MNKTMGYFISILTVCSLVFGSGIYVGQLRKDVDTNTKALIEVTDALREVTVNLKAMQSGTRFTLEDAERWRASSYENYVNDGSESFWLSKPEHKKN